MAVVESRELEYSHESRHQLRLEMNESNRPKEILKLRLQEEEGLYHAESQAD